MVMRGPRLGHSEGPVVHGCGGGQNAQHTDLNKTRECYPVRLVCPPPTQRGRPMPVVFSTKRASHTLMSGKLNELMNLISRQLEHMPS